MAFVAVAQNTGELLGVVRLIADPDYTRGEYAILVRSDLKGRGLGWRLMQHLIDYAKAEGLKELHGSVLAENSTMLRMCRGARLHDRERAWRRKHSARCAEIVVRWALLPTQAEGPQNKVCHASNGPREGQYAS